MFRLGPLHVNVRKGFEIGGVSFPVGTDRMANFTCIRKAELR